MQSEGKTCDQCAHYFQCEDAVDNHLACGGFKDAAKKKTLFQEITASPEVLAEEFVEMMYDRVAGDYRYYSMLTGEFYNSREEAHAATVEKLNEVTK